MSKQTGTSEPKKGRSKQGRKYFQNKNAVVAFDEQAAADNKSPPELLRAQIKKAVAEGPPKLREGWAEPAPVNIKPKKSPKTKGRKSPRTNKRGGKKGKHQEEQSTPVEQFTSGSEEDPVSPAPKKAAPVKLN